MEIKEKEHKEYVVMLSPTPLIYNPTSHIIKAANQEAAMTLFKDELLKTRISPCRGERIDIYQKIYTEVIWGNYKIMLVPYATGTNGFYSIEAGLADGEKNFDHHGQYEKEPNPCVDERVREILDKEFVIEVSHMDADTYITLMKLLNGTLLPAGIDCNLIAKFDEEGIPTKLGFCQELFERNTVFYAIGIGQIAQKVGFPKVGKDPQDVTRYIVEMLKFSTEEIISAGKSAFDEAEQNWAYHYCKDVWKPREEWN